MYILARHLSEKLDRILGIRGNTGSGKSTSAPLGALNVDVLKAALKKGYKVLNSQLHPEAAKIFERFLQGIIKTLTINFCLNSRLIEPEDMESWILKPAKQRGVSAEIKDFEVPLSTSLLRALTRDPYGKDPCSSLEIIIDGFVRLRRDRATIIARIKDDKAVTNYELCFKQGSSRILVAHKKDSEFKIFDQALYDECMRVPSKDEINQLINQIITPDLIQQAISDGDIYSHQSVTLEPFLGKTLAEANAHRT